MGGKLSKKKKGYNVSDPKDAKKGEDAVGQVEKQDEEDPESQAEAKVAMEQSADASKLGASKETLEDKPKEEPNTEENKCVQEDKAKETGNGSAEPMKEIADKTDVKSQDIVAEAARGEGNSEEKKAEEINQQAKESTDEKAIEVTAVSEEKPVETITEQQPPKHPEAVLQGSEVSPAENANEMPAKEGKVASNVEAAAVPTVDHILENKEEVEKASSEKTEKKETASASPPAIEVIPESTTTTLEEVANIKTCLEKVESSITEPTTKALAEEEEKCPPPTASEPEDCSSSLKAEPEAPDVQKDIEMKPEDVIIEESINKSEAANEQSHSPPSQSSVPDSDLVQQPVPTIDSAVEEKNEVVESAELVVSSPVKEEPSPVTDISGETVKEFENKEASISQPKSTPENAQDTELSSSTPNTSADSMENQPEAEEKAKPVQSEEENENSKCLSQDAENKESIPNVQIEKVSEDTAAAQVEPPSLHLSEDSGEGPKEITPPALNTETIPQIIISESLSTNEFPEDETEECAGEAEKAASSPADGAFEKCENESGDPSPAANEAEVTSETEIGGTTANQEVKGDDAKSDESSRAMEVKAENGECDHASSTEATPQPSETVEESAVIPEHQAEQNGAPDNSTLEQAVKIPTEPQHEECVNSINKMEESPKEQNGTNGCELKKNLNLIDDKETPEANIEIPEAINAAAGNQVVELV
ncbi:enolase-phosphatase E1 [Amia ocellicauda]|uniref:enolase-phosphatase E1 n=1 Tax=Amia ocellicauda TaxID=2972642 RepID=UPI003464A267